MRSVSMAFPEHEDRVDRIRPGPESLGSQWHRALAVLVDHPQAVLRDRRDVGLPAVEQDDLGAGAGEHGANAVAHRAGPGDRDPHGSIFPPPLMSVLVILSDLLMDAT